MLMSILMVTTQLWLANVNFLAQDGGRRGARGYRGAEAKQEAAQDPGGRGRSRGQQKSGPREDVTVRVFQLQHADAIELRGAIHRIIKDAKIAADERSNSLIVSATAKAMVSVEAILKDLDRPIDQSMHETDLSVVMIVNRDVRELSKQVVATFESPELKVVADRARATIMLNGPNDDVAKAKRLLEQLDTPAATVELEFAFFKAQLKPGKTRGENGLEMPKDLQEIAGELERFGRIELLGRLSTIAVQEEEFQVRGGIANMIDAEVEGALTSGSAGETVRIRLHAEMRLQKPSAQSSDEDVLGGRKRPRPEFGVHTTVSTKRGDYIVLGSAPNGWEAGESAILVLYVRR